MQKTLSLAAIGLRGVPVVQAVELASAAGFDSLAVDINELQMLVGDLGIDAVRSVFESAGVTPGFWGLPFSWADDEKRTAGLEALPAQLDVAQKLGVPLAASGVSPVSDERDYAENLAWHAPKLREVGEVLKAGGVRLALEFIGPKTIRKDHKYEFAYSLPRMLELIDAAGTGNIGTTLDIWHLYTSGGTNADLDTLPLDRVDIVHVNDAPTGIDRDEQQDLVRALPLATGVLDIVGFMQRLQKIGFNGPVMPEPFSKALDDLAAIDPLAAAKETARSMNELWSAAGL